MLKKMELSKKFLVISIVFMTLSVTILGLYFNLFLKKNYIHHVKERVLYVQKKIASDILQSKDISKLFDKEYVSQLSRDLNTHLEISSQERYAEGALNIFDTINLENIILQEDSKNYFSNFYVDRLNKRTYISILCRYSFFK